MPPLAPDAKPTLSPSRSPSPLPVKHNQHSHLTVPLSEALLLRAASPDTLSELSIALTPRHSHTYRHASRSLSPPTKPGTWRASASAFWKRNKGLALVLLAQVFGTLMNVATRLLEVGGNAGKGMHPFQILIARQTITLVLSMTYMWRAGTPDFPLGARNIRGLLLVRGVGGFFGVFGMYYSLKYLPLADATVLTFLAPILACWACSYILHEPFTRREQLAALVSLGGVVLIARPATIFQIFSSPSPVPPVLGGNSTLPLSSRLADFSAGNVTAAAAENAFTKQATPHERALAVGFALLGVLGGACAFTTLRAIGKRASALITVTYFAFFSALISFVMLVAVPSIGFLLPVGLYEWFLLLSLGVCGFVMQCLLAAGLQYEKSSRATNMVYAQMVFALAFDRLIFGTVPGLASFLGSGLILGSAIYVALHQAAAKKPVVEVGVEEEARGLVSAVDAVDGEEVEMRERN
ncbi:hypothetical protein EJ06DRAFT_531262 [Trichodelitschia bisporula]|uniref:EamA domain-containing protein n=1 Tax=Trichodelitschia bisporula TaxID=703511 RepID=A0A6G1HT90_9PEZI|nr:hypothetical protein EJ06DRAFT_531262 [Trichodelitschia bisporula]